MRPASVVFLTPRGGAPARYRCLHAAEQLFLQGVPSAVFPAAHAAAARRALKAGGILVLHRVPLGPVVERLIREAENRGVVPVFDCDDDIFRTPPDLRGPRTALNRLRRALFADEVRRYRSAARRCRALLLSTEPLSRSARRIGRPGFVHPNAYSRRLLELSDAVPIRPSREEVVLGYASGTPTHDRDFLRAKPALVRVLAEHPTAELRIVGPVEIGDGWGAAAARVRRFPAVPWERLPELLATFDVNLAPLDLSDPFVAAKSEVKYIEAALVGVPTLASPTEAFSGAIRSGENGLLAGTPDEWREALERLVTEPALRLRLGQAAREDVRERYSPNARAKDLLRTLREILSMTGKSAPAAKEPPDPVAAPPGDVPAASWPARACFTLRNRGPGIVLRQILARVARATSRGRSSSGG